MVGKMMGRVTEKKNKIKLINNTPNSSWAHAENHLIPMIKKNNGIINAANARGHSNPILTNTVADSTPTIVRNKPIIPEGAES